MLRAPQPSVGKLIPAMAMELDNHSPWCEEPRMFSPSKILMVTVKGLIFSLPIFLLSVLKRIVQSLGHSGWMCPGSTNTPSGLGEGRNGYLEEKMSV